MCILVHIYLSTYKYKYFLFLFFFFSRDNLTLAEVLDLLDGGDVVYDTADVYIEPPEPSILTDEDSGSEDEAVVDNLSGNQLLANAEVSLHGFVPNEPEEVLEPQAEQVAEPQAEEVEHQPNQEPAAAEEPRVDPVEVRSPFTFPKPLPCKFIRE